MRVVVSSARPGETNCRTGIFIIPRYAQHVFFSTGVLDRATYVVGCTCRVRWMEFLLHRTYILMPYYIIQCPERRHGTDNVQLYLDLL
jgi:hypothetical protein